MKMLWLLRILAALLVVVPGTLAAIEAPSPDVGSDLRRRYCPGCYSAILQVPRVSPTLASIRGLLESIKRQPSLEDSALTPSRQAERKRPRTPCVGCFTPLDASKVAVRARREERKVVSTRRRGKLPGTRPVCRGCFSGLMLMGRPAEGGVAEGTLPKSLSESGEDSSGGD